MQFLFAFYLESETREPLHSSLHKIYICNFTYTIVSRKYAPPFATLALVQNVGGGGVLYAGCNIFSRDYALPSGAT